jgi:hypothetical protein
VLYCINSDILGGGEREKEINKTKRMGKFVKDDMEKQKKIASLYYKLKNNNKQFNLNVVIRQNASWTGL